MNSQIKKIELKAKKYFEGTSGCHDWTHVERVRKMAIRIGTQESADLIVVEIAALLHDIGRKEEVIAKGSFCHAEHGATLSKKILDEIKITAKQKENILHSITAHRFSNNHEPSTIEAKCLFDADKLDSIGAVGVARIFLFAGQSASNLLYTGREKEIAKSGKKYSFTDEDTAVLEWEIKLKYVKDKMLTKTGKDLAKRRYEYMKNYFNEFWLEVEGKN